MRKHEKAINTAEVIKESNLNKGQELGELDLIKAFIKGFDEGGDKYNIAEVLFDKIEWKGGDASKIIKINFKDARGGFEFNEMTRELYVDKDVIKKLIVDLLELE